MYILKTKGSDKIPDYIQIRDNEFSLVAHFKAKSPGRAIFRHQLGEFRTQILDHIENLEYGVLTKLN
jgi:hypothetical protein